MYKRKRQHYSHVLLELEQERGIIYRPLVWSTWGRAHPETHVILRTLAIQAARRHGLRDHALVLRRTRAAIGVQLMRRAVRMLRACIPHLHQAEESLLVSDAVQSFSGMPRTREIILCDGDADAG